MGLDMYLLSVPKIKGMDYEEILLANVHLGKHKAEQDETYERLKPHIKHFEKLDFSWSSLFEEIAYWRKANQIHNWFVDTIHNGEDEPCFTEEVTKENLKNLYILCLKVLTKRVNPEDILPTKPGCYFGSTEYDAFYYREIDETKSLLANLLANFNFETHYLVYQCTW